jgi:hypothetical protein
MSASLASVALIVYTISMLRDEMALDLREPGPMVPETRLRVVGGRQMVMVMDVDATDRALLDLLRSDGRLSMRELAP